MNRPAEELEGKTLPGGWKVLKKVVPRPTATGGHFSTGYLVEQELTQRQGFLKAMDYSAAFQAPNTIDMMKLMADGYTFERDICIKCKGVGINRVVHAIDHGTYEPSSGSPFGQFLKVEYLIFERADRDVRAHLDQQAVFDIAFALRTLHNVAAALEQLHQAGIAHQDVKPSNVLMFAESGVSKLGDLGRAWAKDMRAPHDDYQVAGDLGYAPFELLLEAPVDENTKHFGYDMYLLGSLIVFLFSRVHVNSLIMKYLMQNHWPQNYKPPYTEALPYLQTAFAESVREFATYIPDYIKDELVVTVTQLCDPDPSKRGHPLNRRDNRFSLERYISKLNLLAYRAEVRLRMGVA